ncbi:MAG TPA: AmmeMemoRadiSam system protein A [Usitatibacter sp.]|nr:AmmeMemoRadiSam system protein A [Usitatibacter sp.]
MPEPERGRILIGIAREAIAGAAAPGAPRSWEHAWLLERGASFVTIRDAAGELRGCIGTVDAHRALGDDVAHNAHAAAYRDPRFAPVDPRERPSLGVEVSVLTPRVAIAVSSEEEAIACLRPGEDGVVFEYAGRHATFLPQVWESLPDPLDFLSELRRKAHLPARFWHREVRLWRYGVEKHK